MAAGVAKALASGLKMLIGRPRPRAELMDPHSFPGPWGLYPIRIDGQWRLVHAWDRAAGAGADLWSMPSSHALFAAMLTAFLSTLYPRAGWIFITLAALVGIARIAFTAHWPSDVVIGWALGAAIGLVITQRGLGVRLLDWIWLRFVDRTARPAWGRLVP